MNKKATCGECGLLAVRNAADASVYGADEKLRLDGILPMRQIPGTQEPHLGASIIHRSDTLICYLGRNELLRLALGQNCRGAMMSEHDCPHAIKWVPGRSPEQHLAMYELQEQREHNAKMLKEERDWKDQDRRERDKEAERVESRHRENWRSTERRFWIGLFAAVAFGLLGKWIEGKWINPPATSPAPAPVINVTVPPVQVITQPAPPVLSEPERPPATD